MVPWDAGGSSGRCSSSTTSLTMSLVRLSPGFPLALAGSPKGPTCFYYRAGTGKAKKKK